MSFSETNNSRNIENLYKGDIKPTTECLLFKTNAVHITKPNE